MKKAFLTASRSDGIAFGAFPDGIVYNREEDVRSNFREERVVGAQNYSSVWKNCATCTFWDGERKANEAKEGVTVDSSGKGFCHGFWKGSLKYGNNKCTEWKKWEELTGEVTEKSVYP